MTSGPDLDIPYCDPVSWMEHVLGISPALRQLYASRLAEFPSGHRWRICLYGDEVTPGNPMKPRNKRKCWVIYWAFMEVGRQLCSELQWNILMILRSDHVSGGGKKAKKKVPHICDGMTQVFRAAMKIMTERDTSFINGKVLRPLGTVLAADVFMLIGDEPAIKHMLGHKGSAGNKPCVLCRNCVTVRSDLANHSATLVPLSEPEIDAFQPATNSSLFGAADFLTRQMPALNKTAFEELQQSLGLNHCPEGALWDLGLRAIFRPVSMIQFDWMHCVLVQGVFQLEVQLALTALSRKGVAHLPIHDFLIPDLFV